MKLLLPLAAITLVLAAPAAAGELTSPYVALHRSVIVEGLRIMPIKVTSDSRCPVNARCIWAGELRAKVKVSQKGHKRTIDLVQGKPADLGWATIELIDALPRPCAGRKIAPPYRLKFRVERRDRVILQ